MHTKKGGTKKQNVLDVWIFREDGLPYQRKLLLGIEKILEESVEVHERVHRAENGEDQSPQSLRRVEVCDETALLGDFQKKNGWPKWWPVGCL